MYIFIFSLMYILLRYQESAPPHDPWYTGAGTAQPMHTRPRPDLQPRRDRAFVRVTRR